MFSLSLSLSLSPLFKMTQLGLLRHAIDQDDISFRTTQFMVRRYIQPWGKIGRRREKLHGKKNREQEMGFETYGHRHRHRHACVFKTSTFQQKNDWKGLRRVKREKPFMTLSLSLSFSLSLSLCFSSSLFLCLSLSFFLSHSFFVAVFSLFSPKVKIFIFQKTFISVYIYIHQFHFTFIHICDIV